MIRPLRHRHYQTFVAMGFLLPVIFAFGLVARKPFPTTETPPDGVSAPVEKYPVCEWERTDLFGQSPVQVRLLREKPGNGLLAVTFSAARDFFIKPDLMVYWLAGQPAVSATLPCQAKLLGGFDSDALPLPPEAAATNGVLVLYSLADNAIVEVSKPVEFHQPAR